LYNFKAKTDISIGGEFMNINKKNFYLYALGRLVSIIGSGIQQIAIPLFILDLTGSGTIMGTFVLVSNLPRLIFGPFAGVLGDRFDRKKIMVYMDYARGAIILLLALLTRMDALQISGLLIAQFIISTMDITFDPATQAMLGDIVHKNELNKANSIIQGINSFSFIVGPAMGGILYGLFGIEIVFLINGISFVLSGLSEMFINYNQTTQKVKINVKSTLKDIKEGFLYLKKMKGLMMLLIFAMLSNFLMTSMFSVLIPFFAREIVGFSGQQFGFMETSWVVGILIGNIILGVFLSKRKATSLFKTGIIAETFLNLIFAIVAYPFAVRFFGGSSWLYFSIIAVIFAFTGVFNALVNTPMLTLFQKKVSSSYRSRVFSVIAVLTQLIVPVGAFLFGLGLDHFEAHHLILWGSLANAALTFIFLIIGMTRALSDEDTDGEINPERTEGTEVA